MYTEHHSGSVEGRFLYAKILNKINQGLFIINNNGKFKPYHEKKNVVAKHRYHS